MVKSYRRAMISGYPRQFSCFIRTVRSIRAVRFFYRGGKKKKSLRKKTEALLLCWRRPIFPCSRPQSIVGANELNYRVRNGNGWTLAAKSTNSHIYRKRITCQAAGAAKAAVPAAVD